MLEKEELGGSLLYWKNLQQTVSPANSASYFPFNLASEVSGSNSERFSLLASIFKADTSEKVVADSKTTITHFLKDSISIILVVFLQPFTSDCYITPIFNVASSAMEKGATSPSLCHFNSTVSTLNLPLHIIACDYKAISRFN